MEKAIKNAIKIYSKAKINETIFYFDNMKKLCDFIDVYFRANKDHEYIEIALSNKKEYLSNVEGN